MKILPLAIVLAAAALTACPTPPSGADGATSGDANASGRAPAATGAIAESHVDASSNAVAAADTIDRGKTESDYLGLWTGVEGMVLVVAPKPGGGVTLDMQWDLDNKGQFDGSVTAEGLRFMRNGVAESAVHTNGDATGLKYLAGKQDCLTVKPGEGYCRD